MAAPWKDFASDWTLRCVADDEVDWELYNKILRDLIALMNKLSRSIMLRFVSEQPPHALPDFQFCGIESSECVTSYARSFENAANLTFSSLYDAVSEYLEDDKLQRFSDGIRIDLQSHRSLGKGALPYCIC